MSPHEILLGGDMITSEIANSLFLYDDVDGVLRWGFDSAKYKRGDVVGTKTSSPACHTEYRQVRLFGQFYKTHRIIWLMKAGEFPDHYIDHIDGNGLNNKWSNLRGATPSQNMMNQRKRADNTSGVKGVSFDKTRNKWYAYINANGKRKMLGRHDIKEDAIAARMIAELAAHGQFAKGAD